MWHHECAILPLVSKADKTNLEKSINIYKKLKNRNIDVIIDDTDENFSSKMKKFNLIGVQILLRINPMMKCLNLKKLVKLHLN